MNIFLLMNKKITIFQQKAFISTKQIEFSPSSLSNINYFDK